MKKVCILLLLALLPCSLFASLLSASSGSLMDIDFFYGTSIYKGEPRLGIGYTGTEVWKTGEDSPAHVGWGGRMELGFLGYENDHIGALDFLLGGGLGVNVEFTEKGTASINFLLGPCLYTYMGGLGGQGGFNMILGFTGDVSLAFLIGGVFGINIGCNVVEPVLDILTGSLSVTHIPTVDGHVGIAVQW